MKKLIISIVSVLVIIALGGFSYQHYNSVKQEKEYSKRLAETSLKLQQEFLLSAIICEQYSTVWNDAIDNSRDFNTALSDYKDGLEEKGMLPDREKEQNKIRNNMKLLQNPSEKYKDSYNSIKKMYGTYTKMVEEALNPSGSLMEFNRYTGELVSQFGEEKEQLEITLPANVKKIQKDLAKKNKKSI
jgi:uncharacterized protein YxeA